MSCEPDKQFASVSGELDRYFASYESMTRTAILATGDYNGGIGDVMKFSIALLQHCMSRSIRFMLCTFEGRDPPCHIFSHLLFKYPHATVPNVNGDRWWASHLSEVDEMPENSTICVLPWVLYNHFGYTDFRIPGRLLFRFSEAVTTQAQTIIDTRFGGSGGFLAVHIRMGDHFLEAVKEPIRADCDIRSWDRDGLQRFLEAHRPYLIFLCTDNRSLRDTIELDYDNVSSSGLEIGHTQYPTTPASVIQGAVVEFYMLTRAAKIMYASVSGFPIMAAQFVGIPCEQIV